MSNYVVQYDLPGYPDKKPQPNRRTIIGLQVGSYFDKTFKGYHKWMGGGGIGALPEPISRAEAVANLKQDVRRRLEQRREEALAEFIYQNDLLSRWTEDPEQFAVTPD
jgi:hypothetical protein